MLKAFYLRMIGRPVVVSCVLGVAATSEPPDTILSSAATWMLSVCSEAEHLSVVLGSGRDVRLTVDQSLVLQRPPSHSFFVMSLLYMLE